VKQKFIAMAMAAGFLLSAGEATATNNGQEIETPSIQYYGAAKKYDANIEAAAIKRAAGKIGDLRGSVEGFDGRFLIDVQTFGQDQSSHLGFPVINDSTDEDFITAGAILKVL